MISCSLGDDGDPSYQDSCIFTCNTGYELNGSDTRSCQSNGSWSGNNLMCSNSIVATPDNTIIGAILGPLFVLFIFVILMICGIILIKNRRKHQLHSNAIFGKGIHIIMYICVMKCLHISWFYNI